MKYTMALAATHQSSHFFPCCTPPLTAKEDCQRGSFFFRGMGRQLEKKKKKERGKEKKEEEKERKKGRKRKKVLLIIHC
jgi:hypothetical protein